MRGPRAIRGVVLIGAVVLAVACATSGEDGSSRPCPSLEEAFAPPGRTWVRAAANPVDPAAFPDAQEVVGSGLTQDAGWVVLGLVDPVVLRSDPSSAGEPGAPPLALEDRVPGTDGTTPQWALVDDATAAHMADHVPADGWLLELGLGGTVVNAVGVDGGSATFVPSICNDLSTRSLADSALAVGTTPEALAVALIQRDPTVPELPGSTVPG